MNENAKNKTREFMYISVYVSQGEQHVHFNVLTHLILLITDCVLPAAALKMFQMIYLQSVMWPLFMQVKFILIILQLLFLSAHFLILLSSLW